MHGPAQRLCVIGFRVARNTDLQANTARGDTTWVNSVSRIEDRDTLYSAYQKSRGPRRSNGDRFHHWSALSSGSDRELNALFNDSAGGPTSLSPFHDNVLLFRSRQLNDNDRMWIERVKRDGDLFTVTAHRATWNGAYSRNLTYYDVFSVNIGKLPPGAYRAKWVIKPLDFGESDELDEQGRPIVERPSPVQKPSELTTQFTINGLTTTGNGFAPDDLGPPRPPSLNGAASTADQVTPRDPDLPQFVAPTASRPTARPVSTSWVKAVGDGAVRGALHERYQKVRDRKRSEKDQLQHAPVHHPKNGRDLNSHFDNANRVPFQLKPNGNNLVLFRSRQLNDNDGMWIERVERKGNQFTVTAHRATWSGNYTVNVTH